MPSQITPNYQILWLLDLITLGGSTNSTFLPTSLFLRSLHVCSKRHLIILPSCIPMLPLLAEYTRLIVKTGIIT
jgi:hypothetical protein